MTTAKKILFLGSEDAGLVTWLRDRGEDVFATEDKLVAQDVARQAYDFLVSYGYRHILRSDILEMFPNKAVNLHISYLPWNRGADPNLWSFIEDTPKGVSVHYLDKGIDTGDIIVQKEIHFDLTQETLATSYAKLHDAIQELFKAHWSGILNETCPRQRQSGMGTVHQMKDKAGVEYLLIDGWSTSVSKLRKRLHGHRPFAK